MGGGGRRGNAGRGGGALGVRSGVPQVGLGGGAVLGNDGSLGVLLEAAVALGNGDTEGVADVQVSAVGAQLVVPLEEIGECDAELGSEGLATRGAG